MSDVDVIVPHYEREGVTLYSGDCIEVMRAIPDASVHAVITDPPYGLEFMGKEWDGADGFRRSLNEADAGRESVFGRTSAKSPEYNTGRGVRVAAERSAELTAKGKGHSTSAGPYLAAGVDSIRIAGLPFQQWCEAWATEALRILKPGGYLLAFGRSRTWHRLTVAIEDAGFEIRDSIAWLYGSGFPKSKNLAGDWEGWGTALKPGFEPIVMARKRFKGSVTANVAEHGTGGLHIDAVRIEALDSQLAEKYASIQGTGPRSNSVYGSDVRDRDGAQAHEAGRWPANVVLTHSWDCPETSCVEGCPVGELGEAARYFATFRYEAKAPSSERPLAGGVQHPTVKPLDLMRWLVRLVTPPNGVVLEPFAGSGTTLEAALIEGFDVIGIERDETYLPLVLQRIEKPLQQTFGGIA